LIPTTTAAPGQNQAGQDNAREGSSATNFLVSRTLFLAVLLPILLYAGVQLVV
jgi:hypothetical protein